MSTGSLHRPRCVRFVAACVASLLAGALVASACSSSSPGVAAPSTTTSHAAATSSTAPPDPRPAPLLWGSCDGTRASTAAGSTQCALLRVPVDYAHPDGAHLRLFLIRRLARDQAHKVGELVVNPGGPGASGVDLIVGGFGADNHFDDRFDIVSWDPRGSGGSAPLDCDGHVAAFQAVNPDPPSSAAQADLDAHAKAIATDCSAHGGEVLDHMDTGTTARDLEQIRLALGGAKLNYAGYSYGTAIGLAYAARYPADIRSMVLDGVVEPNWDLAQLLTVQAGALEQRLQSELDQCDARPSCPVHDAAAVYDELAARLVSHPMPAGPGHTIGPGELATAAVESTYDPSSAEPFYAALAAARSGDGRDIWALAHAYRSEVSYAAYVGVVCTDLPHPVGAEAYAAFATSMAHRFRRIGAAAANEVLPCAFWPAPVTRTPGFVTAAGAPTILVVGNTGDAATPYAASVSVARHLARAALLTFDGQGHTSVDRSTCVDSAERHYLESLVVPPKGALCVAG